MTLKEARDFIRANNQCFEIEQHCLFATALKETNELIGFIGLSKPTFEAHFTPCVEVGWRLASAHWGQGYASEGAEAVLQYGFTKLRLKEIVSFTVPANLRSIRVIEKLGMHRDAKGDFAHPKLPTDHSLSHHILYRKQV
jgi:RimJ/RimL family protein N-acetyltransferase